MTDAYGFAVAWPAVTADWLAGARAYPAEYAGQDIGNAVEFVGAAVAALDYGADITRDIGVGRASCLTGNIFAHPADVSWVGRKTDCGDNPFSEILLLREVFVLAEVLSTDAFVTHYKLDAPSQIGAFIWRWYSNGQGRMREPPCATIGKLHGLFFAAQLKMMIRLSDS